MPNRRGRCLQGHYGSASSGAELVGLDRRGDDGIARPTIEEGMERPRASFTAFTASRMNCPRQMSELMFAAAAPSSVAVQDGIVAYFEIHTWMHSRTPVPLGGLSHRRMLVAVTCGPQQSVSQTGKVVGDAQWVFSDLADRMGDRWVE